MGRVHVPKGLNIPFGAPVSIVPLNLSIVDRVIRASQPAACSLHLERQLRPDLLGTKAVLIPLERLACQMAVKELSLVSLLRCVVAWSLGTQLPLVLFALLSFLSMMGVADQAWVFVAD